MRIKGGAAGGMRVGGGAAGGMKIKGGAAGGLRVGGGAAGGLRVGGAAAGGGGSTSWSTSYGTKTGGYGRTMDEDGDNSQATQQSLSDIWSRKDADESSTTNLNGEEVKIKKPILTKFVHLVEDLAGKLAVNKLNVAEELVHSLKKQKEEDVYQTIGVARSLNKKKSLSKRHRFSSKHHHQAHEDTLKRNRATNAKKRSLSKKINKLLQTHEDIWNLKNTN